MPWVIVGVVVLIALFAGITFGFRDVPLSERSRRKNLPASKDEIVRDAWQKVNDHFASRKKLGR